MSCFPGKGTGSSAFADFVPPDAHNHLSLLRFTTLARGLRQSEIYFCSMGLNTIHHLNRQSQGFHSFCPSDQRWLPIAHRINKRLQFRAKRFQGLRFQFAKTQLGRAFSTASAHHKHIATGKINGDIFVGLEITELPHLLGATLLAVRLATAPSSNSTRALAISTLSESTGRPTARTSRTGAETIQSSRSKSWIMRSKTTSTSRLRGLKTPRR